VMPLTAAVLVPPGLDRGYTRCFGYEVEDIGAAGVASLETKMRSAGLALDELPGAPATPLGRSPREQAAAGFALVKAGILGARHGTSAAARAPGRAARAAAGVRLTPPSIGLP